MTNTTDTTITTGDIIGLANAYADSVVVAEGAITSHDVDARTAFQNAYRTVHVARRAAVMSDVMQAMLATGANPVIIADVTDAMANLPTVVSRVDRPTLTDDQAAAIRSHYETIVADAMADSFVPDGADAAAADAYIGRIRAAVNKAAANVSNSVRGENTTYTDTLLGMIEAGIIGQDDVLTATYKGDAYNVQATPSADQPNGVTASDGTTYTSLSAAYAAAYDGKVGNGWHEFRTQDGARIGTLRRS